MNVNELKRDIPARVRNKMPASDFAGRGRSFPIQTCEDVRAAASSLGRAGPDNYSTDKIKSNIIAIAKRKGLARCLPKAWQSSKEMEDSLEFDYADYETDPIDDTESDAGNAAAESTVVNLSASQKRIAVRVTEQAIKALYDSGAEYGWFGVSHNGYRDRMNDLIPSELILADIEMQTALIKRGAERNSRRKMGDGYFFDETVFNGKTFADYGALLYGHRHDLVLGRTLMTALIDGEYASLGMGTFDKSLAPGYIGKKWRMSIGYFYTVGEKDTGVYPRDYKNVYVYERTILEPGREANALTFAVVNRMKLRSDAEAGAVVDMSVQGVVDSLTAGM